VRPMSRSEVDPREIRREILRELRLRARAMSHEAPRAFLHYGDDLLTYFRSLEEELGLELPETKIAQARFFSRVLLRFLEHDDVLVLLADLEPREVQNKPSRASNPLAKLLGDE